jgi:type III pantothenate kinase
MKSSQSVLLIDLGNTRLKWRVITDHPMQACGHLAAGSLDEVLQQPSAIRDLERRLADLGPFTRVLGGSVGAPDVKAWFMDWLGQRHSQRVEWVVSRASLTIERPQGTIRLDQPYAEPERLGVDRWLAALGWLGLMTQPGLVPDPGLEPLTTGRLALISAGTATVVDGLTVHHQGSHLQAQMTGGLIYPGFGLMRAGLADQTADLAAHVRAASECVPAIEPAVDSVAAIRSGIAAAQVGALGWLGPVDRVIVHGGHAQDWVQAFSTVSQRPALAPHPKAVEVQGLVFTGLAMLAEFA